jgi:hypothetical protein
MCKGHCPGTGIDMDWRNKTDTCLNWKTLFSMYEKLMLKKGQQPFSLHPNLKKYEEVMLHGFSKGVELRLTQITKHLEGKFDIERYITNQLNRMKLGDVVPHADHTDATGKYRQEFFEKFGLEL